MSAEMQRAGGSEPRAITPAAFARRSFLQRFDALLVPPGQVEDYLSALAGALHVEPSRARYERPLQPPGAPGMPCSAYYPEACACEAALVDPAAAAAFGRRRETFVITGPAIIGKSGMAHACPTIEDGDVLVRRAFAVAGLEGVGWGCRRTGDFALMHERPHVVAGAGYLYRGCLWREPDVSVCVLPSPWAARRQHADRRASAHGYRPTELAWWRYADEAAQTALGAGVPIYAVAAADLVAWARILQLDVGE